MPKPLSCRREFRAPLRFQCQTAQWASGIRAAPIQHDGDMPEQLEHIAVVLDWGSPDARRPLRSLALESKWSAKFPSARQRFWHREDRLDTRPTDAAFFIVRLTFSRA